ncbi:unnamed protein product [Rhodiola kirilowii]
MPRDADYAFLSCSVFLCSLSYVAARRLVLQSSKVGNTEKVL